MLGWWNLFCRELTVEGFNFTNWRKQHHEEKLIIAATHTGNFDLGAALKVFQTPLFDLQVTGESLLQEKFFSYPFQALYIRMVLRNHFTGLSYKQTQVSKTSRFNLADFATLASWMEKSRTPWIAINPFSPEGTMKRAGHGVIFLAQLTGAWIMPVALSFSLGAMEGASIAVRRLLQGDVSALKGLKELLALRKGTGVFRIGEPYLVPLLSQLVFSQFCSYLLFKNKSDKIGFKLGLEVIRDQSRQLGEKGAMLLNSRLRGYYSYLDQPHF